MLFGSGFMEFVFIAVLTLQLLTACQSRPCGTEVSISPPSQAVKLGSNATISCHQQTSFSGTVSYSWYFTAANSSRPSLVLPNQHHSFPRFPQTNTLLIINVTTSHFGSYSCERLNEPSCTTNRSVLTLFEQASITITPKQNRKHSGETLSLTAVVTGNPLPTTIMLQKWNIQREEFVNYPNTKYSVTDLNTVSILDLSLEDSGQHRTCVENTIDSIECDIFTITVAGLEIIPAMPIVKSGGNLSVVCRIHNSFGNFELAWQMADGNSLTDDSSTLVTQISPSELQLFVREVTKVIDYLCVVRNASRIFTTEFVSVSLTDVPSPPRDLEIQSTGSVGHISITWTAPATDNGSPLTAYYVSVIVERANSKVMRILPSITTFEYSAKCKVINVTVTSENVYGNSSAVNSVIDTRSQCVVSTVAEESSEADNNALPFVGAGIAVVVVFAGFALLAVIIFIVWWKKQKREVELTSTPESPPNVKVKTIVTTVPPPLIKRTTSIRQYRSMLEVPRDHVVLQDVLCDCTHFELCKGLITLPENDNKAHEVMIKKAKQSTPSEEEHNIQEEIKMMSSVGVHENVVGLLRTCLSDSPAYLITEYFAHGDLLGFLRASRGHHGMYTVLPGTGCKTYPCAVQGQDLLKIATQVAAGMDYLAGKVTHRSLCARNVLVGTGLQVKVYNYGPKADTEAVPHNYTKWMAPEMLFDGTADTNSDIWSFGVTLWEIITIGGSPYPQTHPEQMRELLQTGHRLRKPDHCADALYTTIMEQCWKMDPNMRPTFTVLYKQLDAMCKSKLSYLDFSLYNKEEYSQFEESDHLMTVL